MPRLAAIRGLVVCCTLTMLAGCSQPVSQPEPVYEFSGYQQFAPGSFSPGQLHALAFTPTTVPVGGPPVNGLSGQSVPPPFTQNATQIFRGNYKGSHGEDFIVNWYVNDISKFNGYAAFAVNGTGNECSIYVGSTYSPRRSNNPYISRFDTGSANDKTDYLYDVSTTDLPNVSYWGQVTDVIAHEFGHCVDFKTFADQHNGINPSNGQKYGNYFIAAREAYAQAYAEQFKKTCGGYESDQVLLNSSNTVSCIRPGDWGMTIRSVAAIGGYVTSDPVSFPNGNYRCTGYQTGATGSCITYAKYRRNATP